MCDGRPSDAFYSYFNANEEYERRFYSNSYDLYPGSGYWQQFEEMVSARQSYSIASGVSNNTNASRAKSARAIIFAVERTVKNMQHGGKSAKS